MRRVFEAHEDFGHLERNLFESF